MKLKANTNHEQFLQQAKQCKGEVWYSTVQGDRLNLKSLLSEYVFLFAAKTSELLEGGEVCCEEPDDYNLLQEYLESDE